ncbi:DegT/DnrJ/EryC1/StrS family aminotransferase [Solwaraspora sp. WMMD1047]|uniref:DegT/DnrJ/EryC1/StrS family aminotransferase n=1 Tax=Solwaraspora sp. WMMD1047 TaxID=3016102 RepID=UPI00241704CE|nr:DegT/DnrJ/EryC1/StrS family aminotransferase [Solwaraspora sp. WMMD1047]MDG4834872.1 DegT/DnrJ/EryC1/StrS family aminotransferase [Solwaraspora sp. WMMD1047]
MSSTRRAASTPTVTIPFPKGPRYGPATERAVLALLRSGRLSDTGRGAAIGELEDAFAKFTRTTHVLSFGSGTGSLMAALHGVRVTPDTGVLMSPMNWISAILAAFHAGSYPIFGDIESTSPNLDPAAVTTATNYSAVLVTHAFGIPARMDALGAATTRPIVEDASHAHGARYAGRPVGSWSAAGCFSLQGDKDVSGGEGGILTTNDRAVYERALTLGHHPHRLDAELTLPELLPLAATGAAYKLRMPALSAVIAHEQLSTLPARTAAAETNLAVLRQVLARLGAPVAVSGLGSGSTRGWYRVPLTVAHPVADPAALFAACRTERIPVRPHYPDWLRSPLLHDRALLLDFWPHLRHSPYNPPDPDAFPNYHLARRQTLLIKVPTVSAPEYMEQVGNGLARVTTSH